MGGAPRSSPQLSGTGVQHPAAIDRDPDECIDDHGTGRAGTHQSSSPGSRHVHTRAFTRKSDAALYKLRIPACRNARFASAF